MAGHRRRDVIQSSTATQEAALRFRSRPSRAKPIKFIGTGEKLDMIDRALPPERMASRILGMGDVLTLIEKDGSQQTERQGNNESALGRKPCPAKWEASPAF